MNDAIVCSTCAAPVDPGARYCSSCGQPVAAPRPAAQAGGGGWKPPVQPDDGGSSPSPPRPVRDPAGPRPASGPVEGQARGVQMRSERWGETGHTEILTFRVERFDDAGTRILLVPVELRGLGIEGSISDGDWVRVRGRRRHGTFRAREVDNLTTGATVRAKQVPKVVTGIMFALLIGIVAFIAFVAISIFQSARDSDPGPEFPSEFPAGVGGDPWRN